MTGPSPAVFPSRPGKKKLGVVALAAVIFFTVSGGPYGIEPLVGYAGHLAIPLLLVTPLIWDIPAIGMVMELNSMMPVSGGYYQWVKRALGLRWAFYESWWTWLYTFVDLAIYPVFFVQYAAYFFPEIEAWRTPVCLAIVWINAALNIRGILTVGRSSLSLAPLVMIPFIALFVYGLVRADGFPLSAVVPGKLTQSSLGMALYTIIWNYIGWDNATTYASEVDRPARAYLRSTLIAFGTVYVLYSVSTYLAIHSGLTGGAVMENGFPAVAAAIAGHPIGVVVAIGGMASMLGIFTSILLSVSRIPSAMGEDKLLPKWVSQHHRKYDTPYVSIILCATVVSFMILRQVDELLVIDITLYAAGLALEFISLIVLRVREPDAARPFRIPLRTSGLIIVCALPMIVFSVALTGVLTGSGTGFRPALFALAALVSGEVGWQLVKLRNRSGRPVRS